MSKVLAAQCVAGMVTAGVPPLPLPTATILCQGVGPSTGFVILDEGDAYYVALTTPDVASVLTSLSSTMEQVTTALTQAATAITNAVIGMNLIDAKPTGGTGSAPTPVATASTTAMTTAGTAISTASTAITTLKTQLDLLGEVLK